MVEEAKDRKKTETATVKDPIHHFSFNEKGINMALEQAAIMAQEVLALKEPVPVAATAFVNPFQPLP